MRPQQLAPPQPALEASPPGATSSDLVGPFEVTLAAAHDPPAAARAAVSAWMAGRVSETMLADAQLLVVELVANSVRHAHAPADAVVSVRAHVRADVLYLEVEDRGSTGSIARRAESGARRRLRPEYRRGAVGAVGVNRDAGTRVWAELAFPARRLRNPRRIETLPCSPTRTSAPTHGMTRLDGKKPRDLEATYARSGPAHRGSSASIVPARMQAVNAR